MKCCGYLIALAFLAGSTGVVFAEDSAQSVPPPAGEQNSVGQVRAVQVRERNRLRQQEHKAAKLERKRERLQEKAERKAERMNAKMERKADRAGAGGSGRGGK